MTKQTPEEWRNSKTIEGRIFGIIIGAVNPLGWRKMDETERGICIETTERIIEEIAEQKRLILEEGDKEKVTAEREICGEGCCDTTTFSKTNIITRDEMDTYNQALTDYQDRIKKM